ncbi:MAG: MFS transporter [Candidatus Hydrogenedens sp.]|nr:MFS transporter [Candidatus Hydrogenedens sp.]
MSTQGLLTDRRFWPLFWTQFLGAFNDNVFKNALVILVTYRAWTVGGFSPEQIVALSAGLFILPFFLFSATAGQLADKYPKSQLVRYIKLAEIGIMGAAAVGFWLDSLPMLLAVLFFMGLQSAFFGPVKYGILPQLLGEDELVGGNAIIELGTFLSILAGTILAGVLIAMGDAGVTYVSLGVIVFAALGWLSSVCIPKVGAEAPDLKVVWNPITPTWETFRFTQKNRPVFLSILGVSWFWFFAASFMALFPSYCRDILHGDEHVITFLLTTFSLGVGIGSILCDRFSRGILELGLVPLGSIGMTVFAFDLFVVGHPYLSTDTPAELLGVSAFLNAPYSWRIIADLFLLSLFCGFYIVPLQTLVQERSEASHRSRTIAGNNILSALFMVLSSLMLMAFSKFDLGIPGMFFLLAALNAAVAIYIYTLIPEFMYRFLCWVVGNLIYNVRVEGHEKIPTEGAALMVSNHVTFIDWLVIAGACRRPVRLVMHYSFMKYPLFNRLCRRNGIIPIASAKEDPQVLEAAMNEIDAQLAAGNVVCIFPEGRLSVTGDMQDFKPGVERILARRPVPVIPVGLCGLWGSVFSRQKGNALGRALRHLRGRVQVVIGDPIPDPSVKAEALHARVSELRKCA